MKPAELDLLFDLKDEFYLEFSKLVAVTLNKAPKEHQDYLLAMLQETSSVYGSAYNKYLQESK